jgi:hypothetical protein
MDHEVIKRMQRALRQLQFLVKAKKGFDSETQRLKILEELIKEQTAHENTDSSARTAR